MAFQWFVHSGHSWDSRKGPKRGVIFCMAEALDNKYVPFWPVPFWPFLVHKIS